MVIFDGYVSHNQRVLVFVGNSGETHLFLQFLHEVFTGKPTEIHKILLVISRKDEKCTVPFVLGGRGFHWCVYIYSINIYIYSIYMYILYIYILYIYMCVCSFFLSGRAMIIYNQLGILTQYPTEYVWIYHHSSPTWDKTSCGDYSQNPIPIIPMTSWREVAVFHPSSTQIERAEKSDQSSHVLLVHKWLVMFP
jgi:hypothetical protein